MSAHTVLIAVARVGTVSIEFGEVIVVVGVMVLKL